ncbi:MAG: beta-ketoacyl synthase [Legionellaceae bacterium]|nr:beta-ketoacyl synthase [Legionellaceae bacterium]
MIKLPLIVGLGGMNSAGRSSGFHSYKRMICDVLSNEKLNDTWQDLARRMGIAHHTDLTPIEIQAIKNGTLVRRIEQFDPDQVICHHKATLDGSKHPTSFIMKKSKLSQALAHACDVEPMDNHEVRVNITTPFDILIPDRIHSAVSSAGSIPTGFDPGTLYQSHHHPRGLKLAVYGASDALNSLGIEWDEILKHIHPDDIAVYAGSALSQIDEHSLSGLIGQSLSGNRINSKMMALSLAEMPADFVNSYILNSVGSTGNSIGACASFLYNLRQGLMDIQYGKAKVVIVGNSEAPVVPEVVEGFRVMGALATDDSLCELDHSDTPNNRRACRPFSTNSGFTLAESVQFFVLMDDELALKLGMTIYGSVADIFVNADANKKSIASPGIGNYITVAKAAALAKAMLGQDGLQHTYVQAHGTGTPQNRTTESHILNEVAKTFSLNHWPVTAVKSYIGHSVSVAGGDQLVSALGVWQYGWIPGIKTIDHIADDVHQSHLNILTDHHFAGDLGSEIQGVIINSKGFGGNNASALILSPQQTLTMLTNKYGASAIKDYKKKNAAIKATQDARDQQTCQGNERIIYKFGESVMDQSSISMTQTTISLSEFNQPIDLPTKNPYEDYQK